MRRGLRLVVFSLGGTAMIFACGSRTGLPVDDLPNCPAGTIECFDTNNGVDAPNDVTLDRSPDVQEDVSVDRASDGPLFEGGKLDVLVDCAAPSYCLTSDPSFIYKCGVRVERCSSLENCEEIGGDGNGASC